MTVARYPSDMDTIEHIRQQQKGLTSPETLTPPRHEPDTLLIGCIDARLKPNLDIGIPEGKALIHRNVAALVRGAPDPSDDAGSSVWASVEFAINVMHVKHIVVMGHTDCGGIRACLEGNHTHDTQGIRKYLKPLEGAREDVVARGGDTVAQARAMEQAAVRQSINNLLSYEVVSKAVADGKVDLHGWVINTGTKRISELDLRTGRFSPMAEGIARG